jgi:mRNA interferase YafQ
MATELPLAIAALASDIGLPEKYKNHLLAGEWSKHRACHIKPDFLLIYLKTDDNDLYLVRLGSHAELFGIE